MSPNQQFAIWITALLVGLGAVVSICATVIGAAAFRQTRTGAAKTFTMLIQRGSIIRLAAIFAIIYSAFILCALEILKPDLAASIFSGIAGYVLGSSPRGKSRIDVPSDENSS